MQKENPNSTAPPSYPPPYTIIDGCLYQETVQGKSTITKKLCNFTPYLVSEVIHDDGAEKKRFYKIGGTHADGYTLPEISIPESEFSPMNWIGKFWGSCCNPSVGSTVKDNIRFAILATADSIEKQVIYSHLGWVRLNGEWQYLIPHNGNFSVCLDGKMEHYTFSGAYDKSDAAISYELITSGLTTDEITFTLLAICYLSPLNEFLSQAGYEPKTLLTLLGRTGGKKSTIAALFLSHFGNFTYDRLPMSFKDTANSIQPRLFYLKDVPVVIDDFHPSTRKEEIGMTATFQMLARAFGDKTSRGRMKSDLTLELPKPPRCNGIITAEFAPDISESGSARYVTLEVLPNNVDMEMLSLFQKYASDGALQGAMQGYIDYLKTLITAEGFVPELAKMFEDSRSLFREALSSGNLYTHDRIPDACAWLRIGFIFATRYFVHAEVIAEEKSRELNAHFCSLLITLAEKQSKKIFNDKPSERFLHKLFSLYDSGTVFLGDRFMQYEYLPQNLVGYIDGEYIYLIKDAAHKAVKKLCDEQGEHFSVSSDALLLELENDGLLDKAPNGERTRSVKVCNKNKRLALLYKSKVENVIGITL